MTKRRSSLVVVSVLAVSAIATATGCGAGSAAKAVRPDMPNAGDALNQGSCDPTPYIVDLDARELGDLETKFSQGIVVVKRDCKSPMKILADCSVRGNYPGIYTYAGTSAFESFQSLKDADEIKTHLATGPVLAASLDAEVKRGTSIDIAFQQIGTANTSKIVGRDDLVPSRPGGCDGATHFVGTFYLGAFLTKASTAAEASATVDVFKQGGSAKSASSAFQEHHLGKSTVCSGVDQKDNTAPVSDCKAPVSVKLIAIEEGSPAKSVEAGHPPPQPMFRPSRTTTKSCTGSNAAQCATACRNANDAASCASAGFLYEEGRGGLSKPDLAQAYELYKKGCDGGSPDACAGLGLLYSRGEAPGGKNLAEADRLLGPACASGSGRGCSGVGTKALFEEKNPQKAIQYLRRGCQVGYARACFYAGSEMLVAGVDPRIAFLMTKRACDALDLRGCLLTSLFPEQEDGPGVRQRALAGIDRGCNGRNGEDCRTLGKWYRGDYDPKQADEAKAKAYFALACRFNDKLCGEPDKPAPASATASNGGSRPGNGGGAPSGFAVKNDSPSAICAAELMERRQAAYSPTNYLTGRVEPGATAQLASLPDGGMLRFVSCDKGWIGLAPIMPNRPVTFTLHPRGGKPGPNVIPLAPASMYARTPHGLK